MAPFCLHRPLGSKTSDDSGLWLARAGPLCPAWRNARAWCIPTIPRTQRVDQECIGAQGAQVTHRPSFKFTAADRTFPTAARAYLVPMVHTAVGTSVGQLKRTRAVTGCLGNPLLPGRPLSTPTSRHALIRDLCRGAGAPPPCPLMCGLEVGALLLSRPEAGATPSLHQGGLWSQLLLTGCWKESLECGGDSATSRWVL